MPGSPKLKVDATGSSSRLVKPAKLHGVIFQNISNIHSVGRTSAISVASLQGTVWETTFSSLHTVRSSNANGDDAPHTCTGQDPRPRLRLSDPLRILTTNEMNTAHGVLYSVHLATLLDSSCPPT